MFFSFLRLASLTGAAVLTPLSAFAHIEAGQIDTNALVSQPKTVACTLTDSSAATCLEVVVRYAPAEIEVGPFCPTNLNEAGGIWNWDGQNAGLYRVDAAFLQMLAGLGYQFYDDAGDVNVFDIRIEGPSADHSCIAASFDETVEMTVLIPQTPKMADTPASLGTVAKVGLSLSGVPVFADAPSVLDTGHMPVLDVCAGHVDPGGWYHYHATATDLDTVYEEHGVHASCSAAIQDAKAQFGYAFDGFAIMGSLEADGSVPRGLDDCGGHMHGDTYHYHAQAEFPNLPTCLVGLQAEGNFATTATNGIGANGGAGPAGGPNGGPGGGRPDFAAIAATLGVDERALADAMRAAGGPRADLAEVAETLGVRETDLRAALPGPNQP